MPDPTLTQETLLSLTDAARRLPPYRRGRPVSVSCILRWILAGVKTPAGVVRLEGVRIGGRWLTSSEALERFAAALTPNLADQPPLPRTSAARLRASERAEAQLQKLGI